MPELITLKNDRLTVTISTRGAEIQSVTGAGGTEFLWNGDPEVWSGRAPILFPICGGVKEDKYTLEGKEYTLEKHGYARFAEFEAERVSDTSAVFLHRSDENTLKQYPFEYELRVIFSLNANVLKVGYEVTNLSGKRMYFSVGAHEAYACPEGIEEYSVVFDKPETLRAHELDGNIVTDKTNTVMENDTVFPLKYEYFAIDALVFKDICSRRVTLKQNGGSKKITLDFPGHDYFLIWTKPQGKYICLEPWCGIPDGEHADGRLENKEGIIALESDKTYLAQHTIAFEE